MKQFPNAVAAGRSRAAPYDNVAYHGTHGSGFQTSATINMKALVKFAAGEGNLSVMDVPEPLCGDGQVKIEVAFCGVCGTDLHILHDTFPNYPPVVLGHEVSGTVVQAGKDVATVRPGQRAVILGATAVTCGECVYCRSGYFIFCKHRRGTGHGVDGGFTKYIVCRPDQLYSVPAGFSLEEAALTEPFAAVVQAVCELTPVRAGDIVVISGPGPIGLLALKLLVSQGIQPIVAGTGEDRERLAAARQFGAAAVVNVSEQNLAELVRSRTDGFGADVAFECAGHPGSVRGCLESLRPMGRYTQIAVCGRPIEFPMDLVFQKQLTVQGSITYTRRTWERVMRIYEQGFIRFDDLISSKLPISEWRTAFDLCMNRKGLKVLLYPE